MEMQLSHLRSLFLFVAILVAFIPKIAPWRSMRNWGAFAIVSCLVFMQLYAIIVGRSDFFRGAIALAAIFTLYFVFLLIGKPAQISPWTVWQRIVTLVIALTVMLPIWFFSAKASDKLCRTDAHEGNAIPGEILGLQTLVVRNTNGMIRKAERRCFGGKEYEIGYLEDEVPRKVDGPIFASAIIRCTEKTKKTVGFIADTGIMPQSDEKAAMDIAQSVADEVGRVCGFEMKHPIYSSIRCGKSDNVTLFSGHGGKLVAEVLWVRQGKEEGFIRLLLHDTGSICEKSPLYEEIMAN